MEATMNSNGTDASHMRSPRYEDPSAKIWDVYLSEAEKYDNALSHNWKSDMDAILIFAGLFSAIVTAFLVESYTNLIPNSGDQTVALLSQISDQLTALSSGVPATKNHPYTFAAPVAALTCNILWYLSLSFSLLCALFATLVQQWTRHYVQATESNSTPQRRARISAFRYQGLNRFKMKALVEVIPFLLHLSLLFFFAGLFAFHLSVNNIVAYLILGVLGCCTISYTLTTFLPVLYYDCPYRTPLSPFTWDVLRTFRLLHYRDATGSSKTVARDMDMKEMRDSIAIELSPERDERDFTAMCWALEALQGDNELESFVEVIPKVVACTDYSAKLLLYRLMKHESVTVRLGYRITRLLMSCTDKQLKVENGIAQKRAMTCLSAIWSLTMMSLSGSQLPATQIVYLSRSSLRFDEKTLNYINTVEREIEGIAEFSVSARTVVARTLLDMHLDQLLRLEMDIWNYLRTRRWPPERLRGGDLHAAQVHAHLVLKRLKPQLAELDERISSQSDATTATTYLCMETLLEQLDDLVSSAATSEETRLIELVIHETESCIRIFRGCIHQLGFQLTTEFVSCIARSKRELPFEASNTLRRLFLQVTPDRGNPFSATSQAAFTSTIDEALNAYFRLPESIDNILLGLIIRGVLTDSACAVKAKGVIHRYLQLSQLDPAIEVAWKKAVQALEDITGTVENTARSLAAAPSTLDIFRFHMYTNTKLDPSPKSAIRQPSRSASLDLVAQLRGTGNST